MNVQPDIIIEELRKFVGKFDTNALAAKAIGITPSVLSLTLSNQVNVIPAKVLKKLGYTAKLSYYVSSKKLASATLDALPKKTKKPAKKVAKKQAKKQAKKAYEPATVSATRAPREGPRPVVIAEDAPAERNAEPVFLSVRD